MENLVIFIMVCSLLVWLASTLYTLFVSSPYKRDDNADFGEIDIEQAKQLLKTKLEYPFFKSICTNEAGNLDLTCKYATYDVKIQDRKLVIENKFRPFAKPGNIEEEKDCLEAYLVKILLPESDINPPRALGHFRRYIQFRILKRISGWLFVILLILCTLNEKGISVTDVINIWKSKGVSQMCFTDYSEEITIGEALQATCSTGKWSSNKIGDGIYHVTFSGYGANGSLLIILFQTNGSECSIKSITIDGEDITLMKGLFLEALYEGVADENGVKAEKSIPEMNMEELNKTDLEQKRENLDTYIEENEFDEELYDSEVQGFSNQDESDSFSYQLNADVDYLQAYSSIVEEIWHSYDEYCEYTLFDLDQDGIKELITSQGTCDADWTNDVYTIEDGYISMIGQFYGAVMLYVAEDGNGLYAVYGHMGFQNIDQITKKGSQLQVDTIMNGDIGEEDYYSNDNPVNFVTVTDDSLLRQ